MNSTFYTDRDRCLEDEKFLEKTCKFSAQRRSGRGGQNINKVATAVRMEHLPTGLTVMASESRYQAENRKIASRKLRRLIAEELRLPVCFDTKKLFEFIPSIKNEKYFLWLARLLDVLEKNGYSVSDSAKELNCNTAQLVKILYRDVDLWMKVNEERRKRNMRELRN